mmetsp:Transcript_1792/g.2557  ORF Transcript_1792/g.2557 Transcript_1792/m.2557 type:complete len:102 (+) Transcript_1792:31-336(+)
MMFLSYGRYIIEGRIISWDKNIFAKLPKSDTKQFLLNVCCCFGSLHCAEALIKKKDYTYMLHIDICPFQIKFQSCDINTAFAFIQHKISVPISFANQIHDG